MERKGKRYKFPPEVRREAKARAGWQCERCQDKENLLTVHHKLPIDIAKNFFPHAIPEVVASVLNAECLCAECHAQADKEAKHQDYYLPQVVYLMRYVMMRPEDRYRDWSDAA